MIRELVETPRFARALRKYTKRDKSRQECVANALLRMGVDVFEPSLRTHALTGQMAGHYACSVGYDCRILFSLVKDSRTKREKILLLDVGTHDEVY